MDILLAAAVVAAAVVAWTAWEATMVSRLARDTRPLPRRNAAVAGAHRLTVVGQLGLVALAAVAAGLVQVPLWWNPSAVAAPAVGGAVTVLLLVGAGAVVWWAARRGHRPQDRRALLAVAATAASTEVLLRGFGLGLLDETGWSVTAAVLVTSLATGLLQAWRARRGSRGYGFVLATLLGFGFGLLVLLTGSVVAAVALHVAVAAAGLGRTFPARNHAPGCACGHDHGETSSLPVVVPGPAAAGTGPAATGSAGTAVPAGSASSAVPSGAPADGTAPAVTDVRDGVTGHAHAGHSHAGGSHAACGTTCDHAGSPACAACPLSAARV
ncbi:type II CAAX prenyl endopeptidase Rce1 family protein [Aquipuribacter hungaricus]|uniref:Type II CAAX prenyl endopeptidase Rce1 family protein n=1 Tax=Aquipuribacter hungaricus TaxID=545624 RepID=A0ABV7WLN5_9MICO